MEELGTATEGQGQIWEMKSLGGRRRRIRKRRTRVLEEKMRRRKKKKRERRLRRTRALMVAGLCLGRC